MKRMTRLSVLALAAGVFAVVSDGHLLGGDARAAQTDPAAGVDAAVGSPDPSSPSPGGASTADAVPSSAPASAGSGAQESLRELTDAEWRDEYLKLTELVDRYEEGVEQFRKDVQTIIEQKNQEELTRIQATYDSRYNKLEEEVRVRREQAIAAFERFIQKYPASSQTPLAMFRLAELYYDEASYAYLAETEKYNELLRALEKDATAPDEPKYDFGKSLALYERIVRTFGDFKNIDGVYYMRGFLLGKETAKQYDAEAARVSWEELIRLRPDSVYASQAYLRIGEYYFERGRPGDIQTSIDYYKRVMSFQDTWKDRALYKIAWAYYRLSDYDDAIARFVELMDLSQKLFEDTGSESDLRAEAVEYLAISFAESGTVNDAIEHFKRIGDRRYKREILKRLSEVYVSYAKFTEAIDAFTMLQQLYPNDPENPFFQDEIIKIHERPPPNTEAALGAMEDLVKLYAPDSQWATQLGEQKAALSKAQELVQARLSALAYYYHNLAIESEVDRQKNYEIASEKYREFLSRFPYSRDAFQMQFFFGDSLFYSGKYEEAAVQYQKAMTFTDPKFHADAARGIVDSYDLLIKQREGEAGISKPLAEAVQAPVPDAQTPEGSVDCVELGAQEIKSVELSPLKRRFVEAIDVMAGVAPKDDNTPKFRFVAATTFFYHNQHQEAFRRFQEIIDQYPEQEIAVRAATFQVDSLTLQKRWEPVMEAVDRLTVLTLGNDARQWGTVRSQLLSIRAQAQSKFAEWQANCGNIEEAIRNFLALETDTGFINAARLLDRIGRVDEAIDVYQRLVRQFPTSSFQEEALFRMASNYEKFLDLPRAIEYHERLAAAFPRSDQAPVSINNAAFLRIGLHQYREAARAYEGYARSYPNRDDTELLHFLAAKNFLKAGDVTEAVRVYKEYIRLYPPPRGSADRLVEAHVQIVEGSERLGRGRDALEWEKKLAGAMPGLRELPTFSSYGNNLFARVMFRDMMRVQDQFNQVSFQGSSRQMLAQIERKLKLKEQLDGKLGEMARIQDLEYTTAAFYTLGLAYQGFADALREAVPEDLNEEERELYISLLEEQYIIPLEDAALEFYQKNIDIEETKNVWNDWLEKTYVQLNLLRPDLYPARKKEQTGYGLGEQVFTAPAAQSLSGSEPPSEGSPVKEIQ